ncbi:MAG: hypothetical protein HY426_02195 [Candidatus Levybacteria bacterium]|nr:hypothetical protein [Candidatus Levybacteria bacterium]
MITDKRKRIFIDVMNLSPFTSRLKSNLKIRHSQPQESTSEKRDGPTNQEVVKEAIGDATKELIKEEKQTKKRLNDLLDHSEQVLLKIRNIIPILSDELVIDTNKITFIYRPFFFSERIHSVAVKDITDVYIETVPFLATITVIDSGFIDEHSRNTPQNVTIKIRWLWKKDAERARRVITGLMEAAKEQIDLKNIKDGNIAQLLEEIGKVRETKTTVSSA